MNTQQDKTVEPADTRSATPGSVLFVCTMNQIRSPMAEFLAKDILETSVYAQSAGVTCGDIDGFMQAVMKERGIDVSGHEPVSLEELDDTYMDLVVTLTPEAHQRTQEFMRGQSVTIEYWPIANPSGTTGKREDILSAYRHTRDLLEKRIRERFLK